MLKKCSNEDGHSIKKMTPTNYGHQKYKVCSVHFLDGEPSKNNAFDEISSYESSSKVKNGAVRRRSLENNRKSPQKIPTRSLKKHASTTEISNNLDSKGQLPKHILKICKHYASV